MPTYNESKEVVEKLYHEVKSLGCQVIIVNDGGTVNLDDSINQIEYYPNYGYGYALKQGIKAATTPLVLTMDSDGEHTMDDVWKLYTAFNLINNCDMLIGARWNKEEKAIRWIGRKLINFTASLWAKHFLTDLNSGMRIFKRNLAIGYSPILCDTFSFTTSFTMAMVGDGHKVFWFPIDTKPRAYGKSKVKLFRDGLVTVWYIFWIGFATRTRKIREWKRNLVGL